MFPFALPEAGGKPASTPIKVKVRFVGGSKDGLEQEATFRVADKSMLALLDIRVTFGKDSYLFHSEDDTFVFQKG